MTEHYDRDGKPMDMMDWAKRLETDRRVAETTLPDGKWVSTVWLGLDHSFGEGPPLIFETMVFPDQKDMGELDCERYSTIEQAEAGHKAICAKWLEGK